MMTNLAKITGRLEKIDGITLIPDAPMKNYCSFRAGGKADLLVEPETVDQLKAVLDVLREEDAEYMVIGNGSNIIVKDGGYRGVIVRLENLNEIRVGGEKIFCGAGALLSVVAKTAQANGLTGLEPMSGIPGSMGGGVFMNAGAYDGEMKMVLESAELIDRKTGELKSVAAEDLDLGYRHSAIMESGDVVVSATLKLAKGDSEEITERMRDYAERRNTKQPIQYPSAGSFFKRPPGYFAGKLVQDAGCKGLSVGGAQISELHSGFMINTGGATATDIVTLMKLVQNTVYDKFGVMLEPEVRIIGED